MARRRRAPRRGTSSGATLASAFVLSLMLVILVFTQRQISNGVVDMFNQMTEVPADNGSGASLEELPDEAPPREAVSVEFYEPPDEIYEPLPLTLELARSRMMIATERARSASSARPGDDQQAP